MGGSGITVEGDGTQASILPWSAVQRFAPGFTLAFPDGSPATELEVTLADRTLNFLIPAEQLPSGVVSDLMRMAPAPSQHSPQHGTRSETHASNGSSIGSARNGAGFGAASSGSSGTTQVLSPPMLGTEYATVIATPPQRTTGNDKKPRVLFGAVAVGVVVIVAVVLVLALGGSTKKVTSTTSTTARRPRSTTATTSPVPKHELAGPPISMNPATATAAILVKTSDLKGWKSQGGAGQQIAGQSQAIYQSADNPFLPATSAVVEPSFGVLQQCSNLAPDHLQLWTQNYYAGGPPTWDSNQYTPTAVNPTQLSPTPEIFSVASVVATAGDQERDLAAVASSSFPSCLGTYFDSFLRALDGQDGDNVDGLTLTPVAVKPAPGVETLEFNLSGQIVYNGDAVPFRNRFVLMGSGRLETLIAGYDSTNQPIPSRTWQDLLTGIQHRMETTASKR
jgi:hypothetical protein